MRPRTVPWWDRLLIRLPIYLLLSWMGCYGMHQNGWITLRISALLFFALALPLLSLWQIAHVLGDRRRVQAWEAEHSTTPNDLGIPDADQVSAQLAAIDAAYPQVLSMPAPRHGVPMALLAALGIIAVGTGTAWLAWWLGAGRFTSPITIAVVLALLSRWPNNIIRRRIIRNFGNLEARAQHLESLINTQQYSPSSARDTLATDASLQLAAAACRSIESFAAAERHDAAAASLDVLADISARCFAPKSELAREITRAQKKCYAAQQELMQKPSLFA
ncbi:hypothetical protein [Glutamicibacter sp.]|uniref:hypothetical protein n=1 Tax=Glutamicibacter sp. TaxID=1931995 RepID=UPI0028BE3BF8|nr:hypothetical protein [Glutamicibacter sp.]